MPGSDFENSESEFESVQVTNSAGASSIVLVCEHASKIIPAEYLDLGLDAQARNSHIAWDPGALGVANKLSTLLDCVLVAGGVSRLIYDCNRPPEAPDAMPSRSELFEIPGNVGLDMAEKSRRVARYYTPFRDRLASVITGRRAPAVIVTIHSFTRVYMGQARTVELGILHDTDSRLAEEILAVASAHTAMKVQRNQPYSAAQGVTHTLRLHGIGNNLVNVMFEIRNDQIATRPDQFRVAGEIAGMLQAAIASLGQSAPETVAT